jgi:hypothetical protein
LPWPASVGVLQPFCADTEYPTRNLGLPAEIGTVLATVAIKKVSKGSSRPRLMSMTMRPLRVRQPRAEIRKLLESYVSGSNLLPLDSHRVHDAAALPAPLQVIVVRAAREKRAWVSWTSGLETLLFTCEPAPRLTRERGATVIVVKRYRARGELEESGSWMAEAQGVWLRCPDRAAKPGRRPPHTELTAVLAVSEQ